MATLNSTAPFQAFNTPVESALRSLVLLSESFPFPLDIQRLSFFDYLLVHSADANGPISLHPPTPYRSGEFLVRRSLIKEGLLLLLSRGLLVQEFNTEGISYSASESAIPFLDSLSSGYVKELRNRAEWVIDHFQKLSDQEIVDYFRNNLDRWGGEFETEAILKEFLNE